jgi:nitroimidazol reductase NimA-like FMN-containing flavoprotein (pyridoxamine 5'-phosphate oxidase superfamily)
MIDNEEPITNDSLNNKSFNTENNHNLKNDISSLAMEQLFGILCTQNEGQPYGSMIGFAFSDNLKYAVFATPKATRKYENLIRCKNVALVVNNRDKNPEDLMKIRAFTATGKAEEINNPKQYSSWAKILLNKQPNFRRFLESSTTVLFRISITRYFYVRSFQEVCEWVPE